MTANRFLCRHCGVHPIPRPRLDSAGWAVNVLCIEGVDGSALAPLLRFDGVNREHAAVSLQRCASSRHAVGKWQQ